MPTTQLAQPRDADDKKRTRAKTNAQGCSKDQTVAAAQPAIQSGGVKRKASNLEVFLLNGSFPEEDDGEWNPNDEYEEFLKGLTQREKARLEKLEKELMKLPAQESGKPLKYRVLVSAMPTGAKRIALESLDRLARLSPDDQESHKTKEWLHVLMKIPFGVEIAAPVSLSKDSSASVRRYMEDIKARLDASLHGLRKAKQALLHVCARAVSNPQCTSQAIALHGPPGCGKTRAVQEFAKALGRPFHLVALGGAKDSSHLIGHDLTYLNSKCGLLVNLLMQSGCMNPVILFDELDKVSGSHQGEEIIGLLIHLVDMTQNKMVQDRYLSGVDIDFSRALFVFSFNEETKIDPILLDRITTITIDPYSSSDKLAIAQKHLIPASMENAGLAPELVEWSDEVVMDMIRDFTDSEPGVRALKKCIDMCCLQLNLMRLACPARRPGPVSSAKKVAKTDTPAMSKGAIRDDWREGKVTFDVATPPFRLQGKDLAYLLRDVEIKDKPWLSMYV